MKMLTAPDSPNNIDQAIEQALETDGSITKLKRQSSSLIKLVKPAPMGEVRTNKSQEGPHRASSEKMLSRPMPKSGSKSNKKAVMKLLPIAADSPAIQNAEKDNIENFDAGDRQ